MVVGEKDNGFRRQLLCRRLRFSLERFPGFGGQKLCFVLYKLDILYSFLI